jgi:hypothetical protein
MPRRAGDAARHRHRQLRPGHAAVGRRRAQPRRDEARRLDRWRPRGLRSRRVIADIDRRPRRHSARNCVCIPRPIARPRSAASSPAARAASARSTGAGCATSATSSALRVVTMEAEPRVLELTGEDLHKVTHAYGTNGIITEVEMPLTAAYDWVDVIVGFDTSMDAARIYGNALACQDGILTKEIAPIAAPVPYSISSATRSSSPEARASACDGRAACRSTRFLAFTRRRGEVVFARQATRRGEQEGPAAGLRARLEPHHAAGAARRPVDHLSPDALPLPEPGSSWWQPMEDVRRRGADLASRDSCASTATSPASACRWCASPPRSGWTRSSAARGEWLPGLQPAPLHAGGGRHEADRRDPARLQARGRPARPAQPRQDDRLGSSYRVFCGRSLEHENRRGFWRSTT